MTAQPTTTLRPVDRENWRACAKLALLPEQESYVAGALATIAESRFHPHYQLRAICDGGTPVGMLAYCPEDDPPDPTLYWLFRLLVDHRHQRRGHGSAAVRLAIDEVWARGATRFRTMHKPANTSAAALYAKLGFEPTGETLDDGDTVLELRRP